MIPEIAARFDAYPANIRGHLKTLHTLIHTVAADTPQAGTITESLKWNQPAYRAAQGTTLRIAGNKSGGYGIYAPCSTTVIPDFRDAFGDAFTYDGNRGVVFAPGTAPPQDALRHLITQALTYHVK